VHPANTEVLEQLLRPHGIVPQQPIQARPLSLVFPGLLVASGRQVIVKVLNSAVNDVRRNFLRELDVLKSLSGWPGVASLVELSSEPDFAFHACERVVGKSFDELATAPRGRDLSFILQCARELAQWLRDLHRLGVAHRDLSPDHVFVRAGETLIVVDFGMAKHTRTLPAVERQLYEGYDFQAYGMILWEMICGRPLFPYRDARLVQVVRAEIALIDQAGLPQRVAKLLRRCLSARSEFSPDGIAANAAFGSAEQLAAAFGPT